MFSSGWVSVNDDLTSYLPDTTETRQGLTIMNEEFVTFGTNRVMVDNVTCQRAEELAEILEALEGVKSVDFDGSKDHYQSGAALFSVTYDGAAEDQVSLDALERVKEALSGYDLYITGDTGASDSASLDAEMRVVMVVAVVIILLVLLFTSHTYMEIPVLLMTFGMAALMNKGTNFMFGEISFVSNSVAVVLQLALAIDYAIVLCHRYTEEREHLEAREAVVIALSKAIPEISGSSLTTLSGLGAMCFMQFGIGKDLGLILMKAIILSLLSVFTLMPGLLMSFSSLIDRTHHRSFVPAISAWGRLAVRTRFIMPPLFAVLLAGGFIFSNKCPYVYGQTTLTTINKNESQIAQETVEGVFGSTNVIAVMVPVGDYEREEMLARDLEAMPEEAPETFAFLDVLHAAAAKYYPEDVYVVGNTTSDFDLSSSFSNDNLLISILTIVFVILVLVFTFKSAGLPVLLILVIQGSVWINFSFPYLMRQNLFFLSYLVVSSIQMGANIDYAIVIANRYTDLKKEMPLQDAVVESLNEAFPTIITSGSILASAGAVNAADQRDTGGIAGYSSGVIQSCANSGSVGYAHVGYNVGGVAGRQTGLLSGCTNSGHILGRKDVGGIAGQSEPDVLISDSGALSDIRTASDRLSGLVNQAISHADFSAGDISARLSEIGSRADSARDNAQSLLDRTGNLLDANIDAVNDLSVSLTGALDRISPAMEDLSDAADKLAELTEELKPVMNRLAAASGDGQQLADDLDRAMDSLQTAVRRARAALDQMKDTLSALRSAVVGSDTAGADQTLTDLADSAANLADALRGVSDAWQKLTDSLSDALSGSADPAALREALQAVAASVKEAGAAAGTIGGALSGLKDLDFQFEDLSTALRGLSGAMGTLSGASDSLETALDQLRRSAGDLSGIGGALQSALRQLGDLSGDAGQAAGLLSSSVDKIKAAVDYLRQTGPITLTGADDAYRAAGNRLFDDLAGVSGAMNALNDSVSSASDTLLADLRAINRQFNALMDLVIDAVIDLQGGVEEGRRVRDTSKENAAAQTQGKVDQCTNSGLVEGDRNVGGTAGQTAAAVEKSYAKCSASGPSRRTTRPAPT